MLYASRITSDNQNEKTTNSECSTKRRNKRTTIANNTKTPSMPNIGKCTPCLGASSTTVAYARLPFSTKDSLAARTMSYILPSPTTTIYTPIPGATPFSMMPAMDNAASNQSFYQFRRPDEYAKQSIVCNATFDKPSHIPNFMPFYFINPTTYPCQTIANSIGTTSHSTSYVQSVCQLSSSSIPHLYTAPLFTQASQPASTTPQVLFVTPSNPTSTLSLNSNLSSVVFSSQSHGNYKSFPDAIAFLATSMLNNYCDTSTSGRIEAMHSHIPSTTRSMKPSMLQATSSDPDVHVSTAFVSGDPSVTNVQPSIIPRLIHSANSTTSTIMTPAPSLVSTKFPMTQAKPKYVNSKLQMKVAHNSPFTECSNIKSDLIVPSLQQISMEGNFKNASEKDSSDRKRANRICCEKTVQPNHSTTYKYNRDIVEYALARTRTLDENSIRCPNYLPTNLQSNKIGINDTNSVQKSNDSLNDTDDCISKTNDSHAGEPVSNHNIWTSVNDKNTAENMSCETIDKKTYEPPVDDYQNGSYTSEKIRKGTTQTTCLSLDNTYTAPLDLCTIPKTSISFETHMKQNPHDYIIEYYHENDSLEESDFEDDDSQTGSTQDEIFPVAEPLNLSKNTPLVPSQNKCNFMNHEKFDNRKHSCHEETLTDDDQAHDKSRVSPKDMLVKLDSMKAQRASKIMHERISDDDSERNNYDVNPSCALERKDRVLRGYEALKCDSYVTICQDNCIVDFSKTGSKESLVNTRTHSSEMLLENISDDDTEQCNYHNNSRVNFLTIDRAKSPDKNGIFNTNTILQEKCTSNDDNSPVNIINNFVLTDANKTSDKNKAKSGVLMMLENISDDDDDTKNENISNNDQLQAATCNAISMTDAGICMPGSFETNMMDTIMSKMYLQNILLTTNNGFVVSSVSCKGTGITQPVAILMNNVSPQSTLKPLSETEQTITLFSSSTTRCQPAISLPTVLKDYTSQINPLLPSDAARYDCNLCGKWFIGEQSINAHVATHKKAYKCKECCASFNWLGNLREHIKVVHRKLRPFHCGVCAKSFSKKYHLQQHMIIHAGDTPYRCRICRKSFSFSVHLKRHSLQHLPAEKLHACSKCSHTFSDKNNLKMHFLRHGKPEANNA
ncbi:uncharacterized protein LOC127881360 [Dreissena polymorpha]|uniref:C2H2-type domain-containing protein n=1 Tax=Dreissena polymorpha TaxID=45954 RepID=A0A9D4JWR8_DREPO|nr:uncharacterized protein LOC127881360 [Dreissena polymorpha]KAH3826851.1 hypothetical protein DPMN_128763 [Dreissena polymorpha]